MWEVCFLFTLFAVIFRPKFEPIFFVFFLEIEIFLVRCLKISILISLCLNSLPFWASWFADFELVKIMHVVASLFCGLSFTLRFNPIYSWFWLLDNSRLDSAMRAVKFFHRKSLWFFLHLFLQSIEGYFSLQSIYITIDL
jgi:hypothetical protein